MDVLHRWLTDPEFAPWRAATQALADAGDKTEIEDAFGPELQFGTGGMRGRCGPGPGRMNGWVVARAAQGLADYIRAKGLPRRVVIGYDVRRDSRAFAETTARVLAHNDVEVLFTDGLCSTPQLSFSVPRLGCGAGVMITASHNPPTDNGYKCYQAAGYQFAPPADAVLVSHVRAASPPGEGEMPAFADAVRAGRIRHVREDVRNEYVAASRAACRLDGLSTSSVGVLYTPYHGVGTTSVVPVLLAAGFRVRLLESQARPDPNFRTLPGGIANPEEPATFFRALCAARDEDDLIIASDPDADRIGAMVRKTPGGEWIWLDGHRLMCLLCDFACRRWAASKPDRRGIATRSLVTTAMMDPIAAESGVSVAGDLLVGLKYTGRLIAALRSEPELEFVFGGEEAHGYLSGTHCLDKDAANAAGLMTGLVAEQKARGRTAYQHVLDLYRRHGVFANPAANLSLTPAEGGLARAERILSRLRSDPPRTLAGRPVRAVIDYHNATKTHIDLATGARQTVPADPGNVLVFLLSEDGVERITVRPSGTEPKMKLYGQLRRAVAPDADDATVEAAAEAADAEMGAALAAAAAEWRRI